MDRRTLAVLTTLAFAAAPATASADAIVFRRDGDIWTMKPDGSAQRRVAQGSFAWPSQADDGTIAAADAAGAIHRLTPAGAEIGSPLPTPATQATPDTPAEPPTHVRISPDATKIAFDEQIADEATTLWTPADATGMNYPGQSAGQEQLEAPSWIGDGQVVLSRDVAALGFGGTTYALYKLGGDDSAIDYLADDRADWASGFEAAVSRDGHKLAALADDGAEFGGFPQRAELRVYQDGAIKCDLALPPDENVGHTSPTFSPDGTRLAWAQADGIHVAPVCGGPGQVVAGPGAWEPYWSGAKAPSGGGSSPGAGSRLALKVQIKRRPLRARITCSAACVLRVRLAHGGRTVTLAKRTLKAAGKVTVRLHPRKVKRGARLKLRVSAPGASPVLRALRAG